MVLLESFKNPIMLLALLLQSLFSVSSPPPTESHIKIIASIFRSDPDGDDDVDDDGFAVDTGFLGAVDTYDVPVNDMSNEIVTFTGLSDESAETFSNQILQKTRECLANFRGYKKADGEFTCPDTGRKFSFMIECVLENAEPNIDYTTITVVKDE